MTSPASHKAPKLNQEDPIGSTTSKMSDLSISPQSAKKSTPRKLHQKDPVPTNDNASQPSTPSPTPKRPSKSQQSSKPSTPAKEEKPQSPNPLGEVSGLAGKAGKLASPLKDTVQNGVEKGKETVQNTAPVDLSVLKGLEVGDGGEVLGQDGNPLGHVVEGSPEDLVGQVVGEKGEILDEDGDLIGRVETVANDAAEKAPDGAVKDTVQNGVQKGKETLDNTVPVDLSMLKGLEVGDGGQVLGQDGNPLGRVVEGDPGDLVGHVVGEKGEILDEDGDLVGRVEALPNEALEKTQEAPEQVQKTTDQVQGTVAGLADLEGLPVADGGEIKDKAGNVVANIVEGDPEDLVGYVLNNEGEVVDDDGDAIGRAELVPQAADDAKGAAEDGAEDGAEDDQGSGFFGSVKDSAKNAAGSAKDSPPDTANKGISMVDRTTEGANDDAENAKSNVDDPVEDASEAVPDDAKDTTEGVAEDAQEATEKLPPLSALEGLKCNKMGKIVDSATGKPMGELIEGDPKKIAKLGSQLDDKGQFWDNRGNVIGKAQSIPVEDSEEEPSFAGLEGLCVVENGFVEDHNEKRVGRIVEGDAKKLLGRAVDEDGDVLDKYGNVLAKAERWEEPEEPEPEPLDLSSLDGLTPNKLGFVIGSQGVPVARVVEGKPKELAGKKIEDGQIWDGRRAIGRVELIPDEERENKPEGPFAGLDNIVVTKEGFVQDDDGNVVGKVIEGDPKKLRGRVVDEDGDIIDKFGNAVGHAERYEPPSEEDEPQEDLSILEGKTVNKAGNVVDDHGTVYGRIVSGDKRMAGRRVDGEGQVWSDDGKVIGRAQLIPGAEQQKPEGPFYGFDNAEVGKDGVVTDSGRIIGRVIDGDAKRLLGRKVDEDGEVIDKNGNVLAKAERWEPEEKKRNVNPMAGRKVTREGEVRDADGNLIGKLTSGNLATLVGKEIDDNGYVVDNDGNKIGECTLLDNIPQEPEPSPEEKEAQKNAEEDKKLAVKMSTIVGQALDRLLPVCKMITEVINPPKHSSINPSDS